MTLKEIFNDLSDGILILNQEGDITYYNQPASNLISGETLDSIGLGSLQTMMHLVLRGELSTPVRFVEKPFPGTEYLVKIMTMYSFYVVQFVETKRPSDFQQLKTNAIQMVNDKLGTKLSKLTESLSLLKTYYRTNTQLAPEYLHNSLISQSQSLMQSIAELDQLAELYLKKPSESFTSITPVSLLKASLAQVETICLKKGIKVRIRKRRSSPVKLYCNVTWMKMAVTECLLKFIELSDSNSVILLKMDLHGHYLSIVIERTTDDATSYADNENETWLDYNMRAHSDAVYSYQRANFDLLMAERVVNLHGGTLKLTDTSSEQRFIIEIPVGYSSELEAITADDQLRIYAEDLAKLQARQVGLAQV